MKAKALAILALLLLLVATVFGRADAAYSPPVSWLPMSMPSVTYDPITNKLAVETKPAVPLGTNVNSTTGQPAPGIGSFDPTKIWSSLNGTAFSRKLGWNDPSASWPFIQDQVNTVYGFQADGITPRGYIWIESTGKSPGINNYLAVGMWGVNANDTQTVDYGNSSGVPYSGIFGTAGSAARWRWDNKMDHNLSTVSFSFLNAANQLFTTTYRLYIGDAAGIELLVDKNGSPISSASTTTIWQWTAPLFVFTSQAGVTTGALVESNVVTVAGIPTSVPWSGSSSIAISGGEFTISTDGGATWSVWTSAAGTVANTNRVKVRQTSAAGPGLTTTTTLSIPGIPGPGTFKVTTATAPGATTTVPNVVGSPHAAAQAAIIAASLNVASISTGHSDTIPAGSVISQLPVAGSSIALNVDPITNPNPAVDLVVSLGPGIVVPNIVGLTQAAAEDAITAISGLSIGVITAGNGGIVPVGSVISQNAPATTIVTATDTNAINLVVSGTALTSAPNVVNLSQANAETLLTSRSLTVGTISSVYNATIQAGSVISQTPAAGKLIVVGGAVNLKVSLGPVPMVTVPNVVGSTQTAALNTLTSAGLNGTAMYANSITVPSGTVISQTPLASTSVASGSTVALVVSSGPAVPSVVGLNQVAAGATITGATLTVGTIDMGNSDTVSAGSVMSQNPASVTTVLPGSAVNLIVSLGPEPVTGELSSSLLSDAYGLVTTGTTIKARVVTFAGPVDFNLEKSISLNGGYSDNTFTTTNGFTTLHGKMTISRGSLRVSNLKIY